MLFLLSYVLLIGGAWLLYTSGDYIVPSAVTQAVAKNKAYKGKSKVDYCLEIVATQLQPHIHLSDRQQQQYGRMLKAAGKSHVATTYFAILMVEAILCFLVVSLLSVVSPIFLVIGIFAAVLVFWQSTKKLRESYQRYLVEVEMDLPKLCSVINSRLGATKNVQEILTSFLPIASVAMQEEVKITLADMKTGNHTAALLRLESRLGSHRVSDVVRGLISVDNGDDQTVYFQSKQHQFNNDYVTVRRKEIANRSLKLSMPSIAAFLFFALMVGYPLFAVLMSNMQSMM